MQQSEPASAVIDTNVVLDWLVFGDDDAKVMAGCIISGQLCWLSTEAMRDELQQVLSRDALKRWQPQPERVLGMWDTWSHQHRVPVRLGAHGVHCADADDQKFIDLAIDMRSQWLFTRDRSLLNLALRARQHGVEVLTPSDWRKKGGRSRPENPR
jgi:putative PIN family toxin of toxin-antitoxin system